MVIEAAVQALSLLQLVFRALATAEPNIAGWHSTYPATMRNFPNSLRTQSVILNTQRNPHMKGANMSYVDNSLLSGASGCFQATKPQYASQTSGPFKSTRSHDAAG